MVKFIFGNALKTDVRKIPRINRLGIAAVAALAMGVIIVPQASFADVTISGMLTPLGKMESRRER